ncbi:MAG: hypothetical protein P4M11_02900 [Candidatus Pacebacteria bacterium]|nr:hypothetical protein [Candidatus Paceibacterota bacterium]
MIAHFVSLRVINLENTHLGDTGTIEICGCLSDHPHLTEVNLARNNISDLSCKSVATLIRETFYLASINLHWNAIRGEGAVLILNAVASNGNTRVLDLSWNTVGATKSRAFPTKMAELLSTQENLVHLDLSNNRLDADACEIISKGLKDNHTLWGVHIIGNEAKVDAKGFMHAGKAETNVACEHLAHRINGRMMVVWPSPEEREVDNCWICEGWNEVLFEWPARI